ncbi:hypothetical protein ACWERF_28315 [Streptomyces griseoluteus]
MPTELVVEMDAAEHARLATALRAFDVTVDGKPPALKETDRVPPSAADHARHPLRLGDAWRGGRRGDAD